MSQIADIEAVVKMLPPSFAVYMRMRDTSSEGKDVNAIEGKYVNAIVVPVLVKPGEVPTVFVPSVLFAGGKTRIHWCLVLLSQDPDELAEFICESGVQFTDLTGAVAPMIGPLQDMSATQVALEVLIGEHASRATDHYDLFFRLHKRSAPTGGPVFRASIKGDPAVSVTPDPIEIPTWP